MNYKTLVLSGGAYHGFRILGALMYMYNICDMTCISRYKGTSVGCMINCMLILQYTPAQVVEAIVKCKLMEGLEKTTTASLFALWQKGYVHAFEKTIDPFMTDILIEHFDKIPTLLEFHVKTGKHFECVTYNMTHDRTYTIDHVSHPDLSVLIAIRMSASVPIYFNQMIHQGELFTDGGVVENFPLYPSDDVDDTLGIYIQPVHNSAACDTLLGYVHQVAMVAYRERLAQKVASIHNASCINIPTTTKGFEFINAVKTILDNISDGYSAAGDPKNRNFLLV